MPVKQNKYFLALMMIVSMMLASMAAKAQSELEVSCRAQAKDVALQAYQGCVTEARTQRLQDIRTGYKNEMADVKAKYDRMLKDMSGDKPTPRTVQGKSTDQVSKAEIPVSGMAKKLPAKMNNNGPALPMNAVHEVPQAVVTPVSPSGPITLPESGDLSKEDTTGFM